MGRTLSRRGGYKKSDTFGNWGETKIVTVNLPEIDLAYIEKFISDTRLVPSRSEYVRVALRNQIIKDLEMIQIEKKVIKDDIKIDPNKFVSIPGYNGNKMVRIVRRLE